MKTLLAAVGALTLSTTIGNLTEDVLKTTSQKTKFENNNIKNKTILEKQYSAIDLADIITEYNLGKVNSGKDLMPSKMSLLIGIKEVNKKAALLTIENFDIKKYSVSSVTIIGKNNYVGEVTLQYNIINFVPQKLADENIYDLGVDSQGNIFRTQEDKVYKLTPTGLELMLEIERGSTLRNLVVDAEDNVYVGSDNGAIYKSDGIHNFSKIILSENSPRWISCLTINKTTGIVYAGNDIGVYSIGQTGNVSLISGTNGDYIRSLAIGPDGSIYAGVNYGGKIYKTDGISGQFSIFEQRSDANQISSLVVDNDNIVYAGSWIGNVYKIKNRTYNAILETNPNHEIKRLLLDKNNDLYASIDSNKVYKKLAQQDSFSELSGIKNTNDHIFALTVGPDGSIYAGGSQGILYKAWNFN
ncbi:hypothetical protein [Spiroplasma endosymbiont of Panzeria rudis]|uniref:hypothetical protein n=1 Tax=Spiroplasma endosymbiont of Panzeria rudis TaxID=3066301 RepID=UPI0030CD7748